MAFGNYYHELLLTVTATSYYRALFLNLCCACYISPFDIFPRLSPFVYGGYSPCTKVFSISEQTATPKGNKANFRLQCQEKTFISIRLHSPEPNLVLEQINWALLNEVLEFIVKMLFRD